MNIEKEIEKYLAHPQMFFDNNELTDDNIKSFFTYIQSKITAYEKLLYDRESVDNESLKKIKGWRSTLITIVKQLNEKKKLQKEKSADQENQLPETLEEKKGIETLRMLNQQIATADVNKTILDKSTLKLLSLDYSADELKKVMEDTRKKMDRGLNKEKQEIRQLLISLIILISVSLLIIFDKFILSKKGSPIKTKIETRVLSSELL